jgi:hypothetical protein
VSASGTTVFRNLRRDQDWNKWDDPDGANETFRAEDRQRTIGGPAVKSC